MAAPKGPWDVPLKEYVKTFPLTIIITDLNTDKTVGIYQINYSEPDERRWLGRVTHYACNNNWSVETMSEKDYIDKVKE